MKARALFFLLPGGVAAGLAAALVDAGVKSGILLLLAAVAAVALRKSAAATRHVVWTAAMACALAMPILSLCLPQWRVLPSWMGPEPAARAGGVVHRRRRRRCPRLRRCRRQIERSSGRDVDGQERFRADRRATLKPCSRVDLDRSRFGLPSRAARPCCLAGRLAPGSCFSRCSGAHGRCIGSLAGRTSSAMACSRKRCGKSLTSCGSPRRHDPRRLR